MKRYYIVAMIALVVASSLGCRGGRLAAIRDRCLGRYDECMPCDECGIDEGIIYENGPIFESVPPADSYIAPPSTTLPAPASYQSPST